MHTCTILIFLLLQAQTFKTLSLSFNRYALIGYANITVKINEPISKGPGQKLITDPLHETEKRYFGNTINRQMFDRQFILDISRSVRIHSSRVYVVSVERGYVHFSWESTSVMVHFIILESNHSHTNSSMLAQNTTEPSLLEAISSLTLQAQDLSKQSPLYIGKNVTCDLDPLWGVRVDSWDTSLRLSYAISLVGGDAVIDNELLNQGGLGTCDVASEAELIPTYCEFEKFFEDDVSRALQIPAHHVQILFIKVAALDSVIIQFRLFPYTNYNYTSNSTFTVTTQNMMMNLASMLVDSRSALYAGNVTIRTDPTWGLDDRFGTPRQAGPLFAYKYYDYTDQRLSNPKLASQITDYDRCKLNRRCNGGVVDINTTTNGIKYFHRLYTDGKLFPIELFLDFENWDIGTNPVTFDRTAFSTLPLSKEILGAHFSPFRVSVTESPSNFSVTNHSNSSINNSSPMYSMPVELYLDTNALNLEVSALDAKVNDLESRIQWLETNKEWYRMDASKRSRLDVKLAGEEQLKSLQIELQEMKSDLSRLNSSQCSSPIDSSGCSLLFNTSSLTLRGVVNMDGRLMTTANGTEVAVFEFDSIFLGPEVTVSFVGQRAIALLSRTSAIINTSFVISPGTLGGFQGGGRVGVKNKDLLADEQDPVYICYLSSTCPVATADITQNTSAPSKENVMVTNINGPGSPNVRILPFVIRTSTAKIMEVQTVRTTARVGQTLAGYFVLHYKGYSTQRIPYSATASQLRKEIENNFNRVNPHYKSVNQLEGVIGVGAVWVSRTPSDDQGGHTWNITFLSAVAPVELISFTSYLQGLDAQMNVTRTVQGNMLSGSFTLTFYPSLFNQSISVAWNESAAGLQSKLLTLSGVAGAVVLRTDGTGNCGDGLCAEGPTAGGALVWTAYIVIYENKFPNLPSFLYRSSPTSPISQLNDPLGSLTNAADVFTVISNNLGGQSSTADLVIGVDTSPDSLADKLMVNRTLYIAYGGSGASHGGLGGSGYAGVGPGDLYNGEYMEDLVGGSGGAMRGQDIFEIQSAYPPTGLGGLGGGAIEIVATNDITIGSMGLIDVSASDGHGSTRGGGGGGSGGAVLLAAGGTVLHGGTIYAKGGMGGHSGPRHQELVGGGGGGGRVAMYGQSVVVLSSIGPGIVDVSGGKCGGPIVMKNTSYLTFNLSMSLAFPLILHGKSCERVASYMVNNSLSPRFLNVINNTAITFDATRSLAQCQVLLNTTVGMNINATHTLIAVVEQLKDLQSQPAIAGFVLTGFQVLGYQPSFYTERKYDEYECASRKSGANGTLYTQSVSTPASVYITSYGVESTAHSYYYSSRNIIDERVNNGIGITTAFSTPFSKSKPSRVTYYLRLDSSAGAYVTGTFGFYFALTSSALNVDPIGIFSGNKIMYGANVPLLSVANGTDHATSSFLNPIDVRVSLNTWIKIDLRLNWDAMTFKVSVNDTEYVLSTPFQAPFLDGFRIDPSTDVAFSLDEIYVGFDASRDFSCPFNYVDGIFAQREEFSNATTSTDSQLHTKSNSHIHKKMMRHYNHLNYQGAVAFDGEGELSYRVERSAFLAANSTTSAADGSVPASALLEDPSDARLRHFYLHYKYPFSNASASDATHPYNFLGFDGVASCSTLNGETWKFEGIVFQSINASNTVFEQSINKTKDLKNTTATVHADHPSVVYNIQTKQYVMWLTLDDEVNSLQMAAIATAPYFDGPFLFLRSLYPDGNQTADQVLSASRITSASSNGKSNFDFGINNMSFTFSSLIRSYDYTLEYVKPAQVSQPVWESVKFDNGTVNFRVNYHRAYYSIGYDNYHDIYLQRWRMEDKALQIICVNKITGKNRTAPPDCIDPLESKVVQGLGAPVVTTRFVDPRDTSNSWWMPSSVTGVQAQPWEVNYREGLCGIRKLNDDLDNQDPALETFVPFDRSKCSNIADNPPHISGQDKLLGPKYVAFARTARFVAISTLTSDGLDTSGVLRTVEGGMESNKPLTSLVDPAETFGIVMDEFKMSLASLAELQQLAYNPEMIRRFGSAFSSPSIFETEFNTDKASNKDWSIQFKQFVYSYGDRSEYSVACVIDGTCSVNFKNQTIT